MSAVTLTLQTVGGREETYQPSHFLARHKDSFSASVWFSPNNSNTFFHHQFSDTNCISYSSVLTLSKHSSHRLRAQSWKTAPLQMPATNGVPVKNKKTYVKCPWLLDLSREIYLTVNVIWIMLKIPINFVMHIERMVVEKLRLHVQIWSNLSISYVLNILH